jgi:predicted MFS family arabinose efflux permease
LASSMGGGAIFGGLWLSQRARGSGLTQIALGNSIAGALATIMAIATAKMWIALPAMALVGFCTAVAGIAIQSSIQLATVGAMRGRVMGLYGLIFRGAPAVGALSAGLASAYFGLRPAVLFGAILVIAVCLWTYFGRERIVSALEIGDARADG